MFKDTPLEKGRPDAISFGRGCHNLYAHGPNMDKNGAEFYLSHWIVSDDELEPDKPFLSLPDLIRPYLSAAPAGNECLTLSQHQFKDGVHDVVYRSSDDLGAAFQFRSLVPYEAAAGFPKGAPATQKFELEPLYSWDGKTLIVPLHGHTGLVVYDVRSGGGNYVAYPQMDLPYDYMKFGPFPDKDGKRKIWASFWSLGAKRDWCNIFTLDLDKLTWKPAFMDLDWAVYDLATEDVDKPWLAWGSYSAAEESTGDPMGSGRGVGGNRVPRLARLNPAAAQPAAQSGPGASANSNVAAKPGQPAAPPKIELVGFGGTPVWNVALDPTGRFALYMDSMRQGMVRLDTQSGELDVDNRWYSPDTSVQLFISEGGDRCFAWKDDILVPAKWSSHEKPEAK